MRTEDEQYLVRIANDFANRMRLSAVDAVHRNSSDFHDQAISIGRSESLQVLLSKMSDEKLGAIVGLRLADEAEYAKKAQFLRTVPSRVIVDSRIERTGHDQLVVLALPVVVAAIYEILMTEQILRDKEEQKWRDTAERSQSKNYGGYWWKPAMRNFVLKHRLRTQTA